MLRNRLRAIAWNLATRIRALIYRQWPAWRQYASILLQTRGKLKPKNRSDEKHLIIVAWEFPPFVSGGVYRPLSFAQYASKTPWKVSILSGPEPDEITDAGSSLYQSVPKSVRIVRATSESKQENLWPLPNIDGGIANAMSLYKMGVFAYLERDEPADIPGGVVLASGPPFHSFVAALWLSRRLGWKLVLDYRDEWTQSPHGFNRRDKVNERWESECLNKADLVIFTTRSQLENQLAIFPHVDRKRCIVIPNGWEPSDFPIKRRLERPNEARATIGFFGNLGGWWYPDSFMNTLSELARSHPEISKAIVVQFVGRKSPEVAQLLCRHERSTPIEQIDHISKDLACSMMCSSDILLLFNPPSLDRYIPGKLYEYIASGRPILLYGDGGEMASIVRSLNAGVIIPRDDPDALGQAIQYLRGERQAISGERDGWLKERTRETLATTLVAELEKLSG